MAFMENDALNEGSRGYEDAVGINASTLETGVDRATLETFDDTVEEAKAETPVAPTHPIISHYQDFLLLLSGFCRQMLKLYDFVEVINAYPFSQYQSDSIIRKGTSGTGITESLTISDSGVVKVVDYLNAEGTAKREKDYSEWVDFLISDFSTKADDSRGMVRSDYFEQHLTFFEKMLPSYLGKVSYTTKEASTLAGSGTTPVAFPVQFVTMFGHFSDSVLNGLAGNLLLKLLKLIGNIYGLQGNLHTLKHLVAAEQLEMFVDLQQNSARLLQDIIKQLNDVRIAQLALNDAAVTADGKVAASTINAVLSAEAISKTFLFEITEWITKENQYREEAKKTADGALESLIMVIIELPSTRGRRRSSVEKLMEKATVENEKRKVAVPAAAGGAGRDTSSGDTTVLTVKADGAHARRRSFIEVAGAFFGVNLATGTTDVADNAKKAAGISPT